VWRKPTVELTFLSPAGVQQRAAERRGWSGRLGCLRWGGIAYHVIEFAVAIGAGIAAGSIALIGFGATV